MTFSKSSSLNSSFPRNWTATATSSWLIISPASGTISREQETISVQVDPSGLSAGTYSSTLDIKITGRYSVIRTATIPVTFVVSTGGTTTTPSLLLNPTSLSFSGTAGGTNPAAQLISIANTDGGTLTWTASDNAAWLTLSPASGSGNGTIIATVNTAGLVAGTLNATITVAAPGATTKSVPVTLTVTQATSTSGFSVSPSTLAYTGTVGDPNLPGSVSVTNTGTTALTVTWAASINWLVAIQPGITQTIQPGQSGTFTLTSSTAGLGAGTYSGTATLSATGATTVTVPVTFTVTAAPVPPAIGASPTSLSFTAQQGGGNPTAQTVSLSNTGGGTLSWSAGANITWLAVSPTSGSGNGAVTVSVTTGILPAGSYTGNITLSATGALSTTVPVTFTVTATSTINLSPSSLSYAATQGAANPANQNISLTNSGGTLNWTVSDSASWLSVSPASGSSTLTSAVNTTGLAAGTYNAVLTVTASGATNSPRSIPVSLTISAAVAGTAGLSWDGNGETDLSGYKVYKGTSSGAYGAPVATLPKTTTSYTVTGLQTDTTYFFAVTAYDNAGNESPPSSEVSKSIY